MGRFDEKIMLVTGATSGIGRAVAIRAAKEGATVVAVGRNEERGAAVVAAMEEAGGKGEFMKCDVSNKDAVKAITGDEVSRALGGVTISEKDNVSTALAAVLSCRRQRQKEKIRSGGRRCFVLYKKRRNSRARRRIRLR